jgi:hypothetical protein
LEKTILLFGGDECRERSKLMILGIEIGLTVYGLYALIAGKVSLRRGTITGAPARIAGVVFLMTIPIAFFYGMIVSVLYGLGALPYEAQGYFWLIDVLALLTTVIGGFLIVNQAAKIQL